MTLVPKPQVLWKAPTEPFQPMQPTQTIRPELVSITIFDVDPALSSKARWNAGLFLWALPAPIQAQIKPAWRPPTIALHQLSGVMGM